MHDPKKQWRKRVLEDWSHNPYKMRAKQAQQDPDVVATQIAEKYIKVLTNEIMDTFSMVPLMAAEVNFTPYASGDKAIDQEIVDYILTETQKVRNKVDIPKPKDIGQLQTHIEHMKLFAKVPPPYPLYGTEYEEESALRRAQKISETMCKAKMMLEEKPLKMDAVQWFLTNAIKLDETIQQHPELQEHIQFNPAFMPAALELCHEAVEQYILRPNDGAIGRVYIDEITHKDYTASPEITTPPRLPMVMVRQVTTIKKLLYEATYRFHEQEGISPAASRMHEKLGDFDISFLHPHEYYNLAEQINFSLMRGTQPSLKAIRNLTGEQFFKNNLMNQPQIAAVLAIAFEEFLPAERLASIGNRFPYHEAEQTGDKHITVRTDRKGRIQGRVEICNFNDATSNVALSTLSILSVAYYALLAMHSVEHTPGLTGNDVIERMRELIKNSPTLPQSPHDGKKAFEKGATIIAPMQAVALKELKEHMARGEDITNAEEAALASSSFVEAKNDMRALQAALIKRQDLLLKRPWGGKERTEIEHKKGWKIATSPLREQTEEQEEIDGYIESFPSPEIRETQRSR